MAHLVRHSSQLQKLRVVLAQFSKVHDELQKIQSHALHLRAKFQLVEQLRTEDPELALARAQQVASDMVSNGRNLSELVAFEAALQKQLQPLRVESLL